VVGEQPQPRKAHAGVGVGGLPGIRVDGDRDLLQQAGLFERLATAQDGVVHDRVVFPVIAWFQRLQDSLPLEEPQRAKTPVGEKDMVGDAELQPQAGKGRLRVTRW
jgi:hypothetical protein